MSANGRRPVHDVLARLLGCSAIGWIPVGDQKDVGMLLSEVGAVAKRGYSAA